MDTTLFLIGYPSRLGRLGPGGSRSEQLLSALAFPKLCQLESSTSSTCRVSPYSSRTSRNEASTNHMWEFDFLLLPLSKTPRGLMGKWTSAPLCIVEPSSSALPSGLGSSWAGQLPQITGQETILHPISWLLPETSLESHVLREILFTVKFTCVVYKSRKFGKSI